MSRAWLISLVLSLVSVVSAARVDAEPGAQERPLRIFFIDVQGGAATLLVSPEGESILIDSGWPGFEDRDPKRIVSVLKDVAGCTQLDHLITTHWHIDHYGGVAGLIRRVEIRHFWDRGLPEDNDPRLDFPDGPAADDPLGRAYREASRGKRTPLKAGDSIAFRGGLIADVLASGGKVAAVLGDSPPPLNPRCDDAPPDQGPDPSDNARSLAFRFRFGRFDFLDCGDLTWNVEKALVCPVDLVGTIDLYQVTHHGLDSSNHPTLVRTIQPIVAVMNNGPQKGGSPATIRLLRSVPSIEAIYQLHRNTQTSADENTDPELIANLDPSGGRYIQVDVAADGSSFSIQIGPDGARRTFTSR